MSSGEIPPSDPCDPFAAGGSAILELQRAKEAAERQARRLALLSDVAARLLLDDHPEQLLAALFERISEELGLEVYLHFLVDPDGRSLTLSSCAGLPAAEIPGLRRIEFGEAVCGTVALEQRGRVAEDVQASTEELHDLIRSMGITAYACHPLLCGGKLLGTLSFGTRRRPRFETDELDLMRTICDQIATTVERSRLMDELRERGREAQEAREAAEAASRAKDRFLATLSHELRTPLTPLLLTVQALQTDRRMPDELRPGLERMRRNVEREARLIDDLLDLTRIARGKVPLQCEVVDVHILLRHALDTCTAEAPGSRAEVVLEPLAGRSQVWADAARLEQVFWNLISNALKFTGPEGRVVVRTSNDSQGCVRVEVCDTGVGIEPDLLPHIFNAFEQGGGQVTRRFGGLGLGLAISKSLVDLHKGTLQAASDGKGGGAVFTVTLRPLEHPEARVAAGPEPGTEDAEPPLHLLLVEDHADTADALAALLRGRGHRVTLAGSLATALERAAAAQLDGEPVIDLVVSDLGLPDGTGYDLMRELVDRYGLRGIALSGYGMEDDLQKSEEAGFDTHLTKPVSLEALEQAIRQVTREIVRGAGAARTYTPHP
ncbi:MAG TPA: ATP-binding protein [Thermoanaerobaculia bacterium]|nr:ATP-binding protein [Thermoanaerobaculia bacterium]